MRFLELGPPIGRKGHLCELKVFGFKGTIARDFRPLEFSMNRPYIVPEFTS
jgi:hypothetical protein